MNVLSKILALIGVFGLIIIFWLVIGAVLCAFSGWAVTHILNMECNKDILHAVVFGVWTVGVFQYILLPKARSQN